MLKTGFAGQIEEGAARLDQALQLAERTGERWFAAELNRQKGRVAGLAKDTLLGALAEASSRVSKQNMHLSRNERQDGCSVVNVIRGLVPLPNGPLQGICDPSPAGSLCNLKARGRPAFAETDFRSARGGTRVTPPVQFCAYNRKCDKR